MSGPEAERLLFRADMSEEDRGALRLEMLTWASTQHFANEAEAIRGIGRKFCLVDRNEKGDALFLGWAVEDILRVWSTVQSLRSSAQMGDGVKANTVFDGSFVTYEGRFYFVELLADGRIYGATLDGHEHYFDPESEVTPGWQGPGSKDECKRLVEAAKRHKEEQ